MTGVCREGGAVVYWEVGKNVAGETCGWREKGSEEEGTVWWNEEI